MSRDVFQTLSPDDEALILGLVEGTLTEAQQRDAALLVSSRPGLGAAVARLRGDRTGIFQLPEEEETPAGLADSAITVYESTPVARIGGEGYTPVRSSVEVVAERFPIVWNARRMRIAAALILAGVGVGVWRAWPAAGPDGAGSGGPVIASSDEPATHDLVAFEDGGMIPGNGESPDRVVEFPSRDNATPGEGPALAANTGPFEDGGSAIVPLAVSELSDSELSRALELARRGRLVVRVVARTPARAEDQLGVLSLRRGPARAWTLETRPPEALASALKAGGELTLPKRERFIPTIAGDINVPLPSAVGDDGPDSPNLQPRRHAVCLASLTPSSASLRALRDTLSSDIGTVELGEARRPIPGVSPASSADDVLWWTQPPARWVEQMSVPVIVEMW